MKRRNFRLTKKQIARLEKASASDGLPVAKHLRRGVDLYLALYSRLLKKDKVTKKRFDDFLSDIDKSIRPIPRKKGKKVK